MLAQPNVNTNRDPQLSLRLAVLVARMPVHCPGRGRADLVNRGNHGRMRLSMLPLSEIRSVHRSAFGLDDISEHFDLRSLGPCRVADPRHALGSHLRVCHTNWPNRIASANSPNAMGRFSQSAADQWAALPQSQHSAALLSAYGNGDVRTDGAAEQVQHLSAPQPTQLSVGSPE